MTENENKNNSLIKGTIIYAIGSFGTKILSFLIVPLYTYYISTSDMGVYDLLLTIANLLAPIITFQISEAAFRWMIREEKDKSCYIRAAMQILIFNLGIVTIAMIIFGKLYPFPYYLEFILFMIAARVFDTIQKLLRGLKNQWLFILSSLIYTIIFLTLNVVQICILKKGVSSLFISAVIAYMGAVIFAFIKEPRLKVNLSIRPDWELLGKMCRFSIPLIPNQLNWWVMNSSDRFVVTYFLGTAVNGVYSIAYKFPSMLQLLLGFFNTSWQDVSVADKSKDTGAYYSNVFYKLYTFSFSLLWILIPATKIFITLVMAEDYKIAARYISFLYLGSVFQSFSSFYGVGYLKDKKTKQASLTSIYGAVINLLVNIMMIRWIGLHAASISTFFGFLIMWLVREKQNRVELGIRIEKKHFLLYSSATVCLCTVTCMTGMGMDILIGIMGGIGFILINRRLIQQIITKLIKKRIR